MRKRVKGNVEAKIRVMDDGTAVLPASFLRKIHARPGSHVRVQVPLKSVSRRLSVRGVTEEEIELIGSLQLEGRADVVAFLESEGALSADAGFRRRMTRASR